MQFYRLPPTLAADTLSARTNASQPLAGRNSWGSSSAPVPCPPGLHMTRKRRPLQKQVGESPADIENSHIESYEVAPPWVMFHSRHARNASPTWGSHPKFKVEGLLVRLRGQTTQNENRVGQSCGTLANAVQVMVSAVLHHPNRGVPLKPRISTFQGPDIIPIMGFIIIMGFMPIAGLG